MKTFYGYNEDSIAQMLWAIDCAYELVDNAPDIDRGLLRARDLLHSLLQETRD
jgi:hypothetical protein